MLWKVEVAFGAIHHLHFAVGIPAGFLEQGARLVRIEGVLVQPLGHAHPGRAEDRAVAHDGLSLVERGGDVLAIDRVLQGLPHAHILEILALEVERDRIERRALDD